MRVGSRPNSHNFSRARRLKEVVHVGPHPDGNNLFRHRRPRKVVRVGLRPNDHNLFSVVSSEKLCVFDQDQTSIIFWGSERLRDIVHVWSRHNAHIGVELSGSHNMCVGLITVQFCYSFDRLPFGMFVLDLPRFGCVDVGTFSFLMVLLV